MIGEEEFARAVACVLSTSPKAKPCFRMLKLTLGKLTRAGTDAVVILRGKLKKRKGHISLPVSKSSVVHLIFSGHLAERVFELLMSSERKYVLTLDASIFPCILGLR